MKSLLFKDAIILYIGLRKPENKMMVMYNNYKVRDFITIFGQNLFKVINRDDNLGV